MRHHCNLRKLNRNSSHRLAMFRNMSISLLRHEYIKTTLSKAKELRKIIEPILNLGKKNTLSNKRLVFSYIRNKEIIKKIFNKLSKFYINRNGGYLKIFKIGFRIGDKAPLAYVELVNRLNFSKHKIIK